MSAAPKADNLPWPPHPGQRYGCITLDPPWHWVSRAPVQNPEIDRRPQRHYPTADLAHLKTLPIRDLAAPDCHVFMWITGSLMVQGVHNMLFDAWGVRPSSLAFVWIKTRNRFDIDQLRTSPVMEGDLAFGLGHTTRANAELVVLGRIGSPKRGRADIRQVIISNRQEHSRKPSEFYRRVFYYADTRRLDMFGGGKQVGFDPWGWGHREGENPGFDAEVHAE